MARKQHELKILPQYFNDVWDGLKTFELRKDDRGFEVGDTIYLREWDNGYTGSFLLVTIGYILRNCPEYGLADGYCIIGFKPYSPHYGAKMDGDRNA